MQARTADAVVSHTLTCVRQKVNKLIFSFENEPKLLVVLRHFESQLLVVLGHFESQLLVCVFLIPLVQTKRANARETDDGAEGPGGDRRWDRGWDQ